MQTRTCVRWPVTAGTWHDPDLGRPIAAPLDRCAELLGVDLATIGELAAKVEPYVRADGTRIWSLMQLERQLRPEAYGRRRGGYLDRRQTPAADAEPIRRSQAPPGYESFEHHSAGYSPVRKPAI
jgi:hypothetical protein